MSATASNIKALTASISSAKRAGRRLLIHVGYNSFRVDILLPHFSRVAVARNSGLIDEIPLGFSKAGGRSSRWADWERRDWDIAPRQRGRGRRSLCAGLKFLIRPAGRVRSREIEPCALG